MKIAICDDEVRYLNELKEFIGRYDIEGGFKEDIEVFTFKEGRELLSSVENNVEYDLVFMDIELGTELGFDVAAIINKKCPSTFIVYISIFDGYYQLLADADSIGFIRKPFTRENVFLRLDRAVEKIDKISSVSFRVLFFQMAQPLGFIGVEPFEM